MENTNLDLIALIQQGAISTYPLLACSILMLGVALERLWSLRGAVSSTAALTAKLVPLLVRGDLGAAAEAVRQHRLCPARRVFTEELDHETGNTEVAHNFQLTLQFTWEDRFRLVAFRSQAELVEGVTDNHARVSATGSGGGELICLQVGR